MALSILRMGLEAGRGHSVRLVPACVLRERRAGITHKSFREPVDFKPFPYETKKFNSWQAFIDSTEKRLNENSRVVVVEGNICTGKTTLAKKIAEEFDFVHFPEVNMDMLLVDDNGFDLRSIEDKFPELLRPFDEAKFYANPTSKLVPNFRYEMFFVRLEQYCDALAHVLNTGQGVVLERSPYSDVVFLDADFQCGHINKTDREIYSDMQLNGFEYIIKPHLIIYLDAPVETIHKRIMDRKLPHEVNSKINWPKYLKGIQDCYKQKYLRQIRDESEILSYDWTNFGDIESIIEDIERVDIESSMNDRHDPKFQTWKKKSTRNWADIRYAVTMRKDEIVNRATFTPRFNIPEFIAGSEASEERMLAMEKYAPRYDAAYDPAKGLGFLFKGEVHPYRYFLRYAYRTR